MMSAEEMRFLRQLQLQNARLRQELMLGDDEVVQEAEVEKKKYIDRFDQAVVKSFDLRAKLQNADKELATINGNISNLSVEDRLALTTSGSLTPPPSSTLISAEDQADVKKQLDKVMEEIQDITRSNLEIIKVQEEDIKRKEKELSTVRRQHQQMTGQSNSRTTDPGNQGMREELQSYEAKLPELLTNIADLETLLDQGPP